jgi:hypothetical protein
MTAITGDLFLSPIWGFSMTVQLSIKTALDAYAPLTAPVYDDVPQKSAYPYVVIGDDVFTDRSTDTGLGRRVAVVVHTWSEYRGKKEIKEMQGAIEDALERAILTIQGYNFVTIDLESAETFVDSDGRRRHGVQTFSCLIEKL